MRMIDESKKIIQYIKENGNINNIDIDWESLGCTDSDDMSIMHNCFQKMDQYGILEYDKKLQKIKFDIGKISLYESFYCLRIELEQLLSFLYQLYRDTCTVEHFKKVMSTTSISRNMVIDLIYNFISTVVIGINKVLIDSNGKYNIELISSRVGKFLKDINMDADLYKKEKKLFSKEKKELDSSITTFNDFRDEFFAHSDQNSQLKIQDVNVNEMVKILELCINYCVKLINMIDDKKISYENMKKELHLLDLESNYFASLTIRK